MIIDIHTHTFPEKIAASALETLAGKSHMSPALSGTEADLLRSMRAVGIDRSVVLPTATSPRQVRHINDAAAAVNREGRGLISLAAMHPALEEAEEELYRIRDLGFAGIKLHPFYQEIDLDDPRSLRVIEIADRLDLLVITHTGDDVGNPGRPYCSPRMARRVMDEVGPRKMIFAHMGGWHCWEEATELLAGTACFIDTAFSVDRFNAWDDGYHDDESRRMLIPDEFLAMVDAFGADRVLFGTDSPWVDQGHVLSWICGLSLPEDVLWALLGGNAVRLLGI